MPSEKMNISIPIGGGLDTKTDRKQVIPAKVLALKNGEFTSIKEITKRFGFGNAWNLATASGGAIVGGASSLLTRGNEVVQMARQTTGGGIGVDDGWMSLSLDEQTDDWNEIGRVEPIQLDVETVTSSKTGTVQVDMAVENGYSCHVWLDESAAIHYSVREEDTGLKVIEDIELNLTGHTCLHVVGFDNNFYIWSAYNANLYSAVIDTTDLQNAPTTVTAREAGDVHADNLMDVTAIDMPGVGWHSVVAYKQSGGIFPVRIRQFDGATPPLSVFTVDIAETPINAIGVQRVDDSVLGIQLIAISWQIAAANAWRAEIKDAILGLRTNPFLLVSNAGAIRNITIVEDPSENYGAVASFVRFYSEQINPAGDQFNYVHTVIARSDIFAGTIDSSAIFRNCCLASRAFLHDYRARVWVTYESDLQSTMFLHSCEKPNTGAPADDDRPYIVDAKILTNRSDGMTSGLGLPQVVTIAAGQYATAALRRDRLTTGDDDGIDNQIPLKSVVRINMEFGLNAMDNDTLGPTRAVATGGYIGDLDGRFQELGFHLYPDPIASISNLGAAGDLTGLVQYAVIYEWTDGQGQVHRSYPALISIDLAAVVNRKVRITGIPYLHKGEHDKLENVFVDVYRSCSDGIYHKLPRIAASQNNLGTGMFSFDDIYFEVADDLLAREIIYTNGGILGNDGPPAAEILDVRQDRILIVPSEDPEVVWYSKIKKDRVGNEFSGLLTKRIATGGPIRALATLDEKEIIFKEFEIHAFSGPGPNDLGLGSAFTESYLISSDVGCVDRASVVKFDKGLMFKSSKGIYLLDRGLQASYIGAPVEDWNQYTVVKGYLVKEKNQIRFLLSNNEILNFDYLVGQWSVSTLDGLTPVGLRDCIVYNNAFHMLENDGNVWRESTTDYSDNASYVPLSITTSWIKLNGLQGFQRINWISILGEFKGNHILTVKVFYDYIDTVAETKVLNATAAFGALPPYQFRFKPRRQKCQAIKLRIYDTPEPAWAGSWEGYSLSSIEMEVRVKRGMNKLATAKTI